MIGKLKIKEEKWKKEKIMDDKFLMTIDILQNFVYKIVWTRSEYQAKIESNFQHQGQSYS